jgi:hypothetical protein
MNRLIATGGEWKDIHNHSVFIVRAKDQDKSFINGHFLGGQ